MYVGFIDLEMMYGRADKEALWQVLRMHDVGCELLSGIKSIDSMLIVQLVSE